MENQKLNFSYEELKKPLTEVRFLDDGQGKIDVYGKFYQGYIDVDKKVFQQERWCTLPINYEASLEKLTDDVICYVNWFNDKSLFLEWTEIKFRVDFSVELTLEDSFDLLKETVELINKIKEINQEGNTQEDQDVQDDQEGQGDQEGKMKKMR